MYPTHHATLSSLDGLFNEFFRPVLAWDNGAAETLPLRVDVREQPEAYTLYAELPGVKRDDIHVEIEGNEVTIRAEAREAEAREGEKWLRRERTAGKAERRFALPVELDEAAASARFADGVLELTLPRKAPATSRKIAVN